MKSWAHKILHSNDLNYEIYVLFSFLRGYMIGDGSLPPPCHVKSATHGLQIFCTIKSNSL